MLSQKTSLNHRFTQLSEQGDNILHFATLEGRASALREIMLVLATQSPQLLLCYARHQNHSGFTPLHNAAYNEDPDILATFLAVLGPHAPFIASVSDSDNRLPIHQLCFEEKSNYFFKKSEDNRKVDLLWKVTFRVNLPPLDAKLIPESILARGQMYQKQEELVRKSCDVTHLARSVIQRSHTHPTTNLLSDADYFKLTDAILALRNITDSHLTSLGKMASPWDRLQTYCSTIESTRVGNCNEFAFYILYLLYKKYGIVSEIFEVGNHCLNVLNRDPNHPSGFGPQTLFIDAWTLDIYSWEERQRLVTSHSVQKFVPEEKRWRTYSTVGPFVLFHQLRRMSGTVELEPPAFKKENSQ